MLDSHDLSDKQAPVDVICTDLEARWGLFKSLSELGRTVTPQDSPSLF